MATTTDMKSGLTATRLRELLDYDPTTGIFRWRVSRRPRTKAGDIAGCLEVQGYWTICIDYRHYKAHRLAWLYVHGKWPPAEVDHKDLVRHHNWLDNLRLATQTDNNANRRRYRNNRSGLKGAYFHKQNGTGWQAMIRVNGRGIHLGMFDTPEAAHAAYCAAAKRLFGEFANDGN